MASGQGSLDVGDSPGGGIINGGNVQAPGSQAPPAQPARQVLRYNQPGETAWKEDSHQLSDTEALETMRSEAEHQRERFRDAMDEFDIDHPGNEALTEDLMRRFELTQDKLMAESVPFARAMLRKRPSPHRSIEQGEGKRLADYEGATNCMSIDMSEEEKNERALTAMSFMREPGAHRRYAKNMRSQDVLDAIREQTTNYSFDQVIRYHYFMITACFCASAKYKQLDIHMDVIFQIAMHLEKKFHPIEQSRPDAALVNGTCQNESAGCPDHLLSSAESWCRVGRYEWARYPNQNRPPAAEFEIFYCGEHERTYMEWKDRLMIHVADGMMETCIVALELFMSATET